MSRMRSSVVALLAVAIAAVTLAGCSGRRTLIRVNGDKIARNEFYARLEKVPVQTPEGPQLAGRYVIQQMIAERLVQQLAKQDKVEPTETQINKKIEFFKRQSGGDIGRALAARGMTADDLKRQITVQQAMVNVTTKDVTVPEAKVRKAYDDALKAPNSGLIRQPGVKISAIITSAKPKADKAYGILKGGTEFSAVALQYTEDPNARQSQPPGAIGWVTRDDQRVPKSVRDATFSLQIGQYTKPFQVGNTWIIVKADQKRPKKITSYDEVKDVIREQLMMQEGDKKNDFRGQMRRFAKKADIVVNSPMYKDVGEQIKKEAAKALEMAGQKPGAAPGAAPAGALPAAPK